MLKPDILRQVDGFNPNKLLNLKKLVSKSTDLDKLDVTNFTVR